MSRPKPVQAGHSTVSVAKEPADSKISSNKAEWVEDHRAIFSMNLRNSLQEEVPARKEAHHKHRAQARGMISCLRWKLTSWKLSTESANKSNSQELMFVAHAKAPEPNRELLHQHAMDVEGKASSSCNKDRLKSNKFAGYAEDKEKSSGILVHLVMVVVLSKNL